jgi:hypothetical protein
MNWIRKVFGKSGEPGEASGLSTPPAIRELPISVTVSVGSSKKAAKFRSPSLELLWSRIQPLSHPDHPFLDPVYSPSTLMPAADYTDWIAERLCEDDWESIRELMDFISYDHQSVALEKTFQDFNYSSFLSADASLLYELKAIAVLCYRIPWTGQKDSQTHLLAELILHSIASQRFEVHDSSLDHLMQGANNLIRRWNNEMKQYSDSMLRDSVKLSELRDVSRFSPGTIGSHFSRYPVTFRACIGYSLDRGSPIAGTIRPQLHGEYGLRQFGLSDSENLSFLQDCGIFVAPDDLSAIADRLQKKELMEIGDSSGVKLHKSWKKDRMISTLLENEAARDHIAAAAPQNIVKVRDDVSEDFAQWAHDITRLKKLALCLATA